MEALELAYGGVYVFLSGKEFVYVLPCSKNLCEAEFKGDRLIGLMEKIPGISQMKNYSHSLIPKYQNILQDG